MLASPQRSFIEGGSSHALLADEHTRPHFRQCRIKGDVHVRQVDSATQGGLFAIISQHTADARLVSFSQLVAQALSTKAAEGVAPAHIAMLAGDTKSNLPPESGCFKFEADRFTRKQ